MRGDDGTWPLTVIDGREAKPCVGCGFCCKKTPCMAAYKEGATEAPCPFLESDSVRHWCGLIRQASPEIASKLRAGLYVGAGCCSNLNSDRRKMTES